MCSLVCPNGVIGGGICITDKSICYKTNKFTVDRRYRNIVLPFDDICELKWKWIIFPVATLFMKSGEQYKFILFNKKRFNKYYTEIKQF